MELTLKSDNNDKMAKILALANKLGISVVQKNKILGGSKPIPPKGKKLSTKELLEIFGKEPTFPSAEEIRTKTWPSSW